MTRSERAHEWIDYCRALLRGETPAPPTGADQDRTRMLDEMRDDEERRPW